MVLRRNIFISTFLTSAGSMCGTPVDKSFCCWFEGIVTNVFTLSAIFWAAAITILMYSSVASRVPWKMHPFWGPAICWGVPVLVTVLPFLNQSYGSPGGEIGWCWLVDTESSPYWCVQFYLLFRFQSIPILSRCSSVPTPPPPLPPFSPISLLTLLVLL
jgi:hypothetical protein